MLLRHWTTFSDRLVPPAFAFQPPALLFLACLSDMDRPCWCTRHSLIQGACCRPLLSHHHMVSSDRTFLLGREDNSTRLKFLLRIAIVFKLPSKGKPRLEVNEYQQHFKPWTPVSLFPKDLDTRKQYGPAILFLKHFWRIMPPDFVLPGHRISRWNISAS